MDIRFGGRGRSDSRISRNDVLGTDSNHNDNTIDDQNDAYDASSSTIEARFPPSITKWDSVHSLSNVKTPARSFYHRSFHGSLGCFPSVFSINLAFLTQSLQIRRNTPLMAYVNRLRSLLHSPSPMQRPIFLLLLHL